MDQKNKDYSLVGKWNWVNTSLFYDGEWQILESTGLSDHIWDFRENDVMESEYCGRPCYRTTYKWDERKMTLSLSGHKLDREGNKYCLVYELYFILFSNPDEFYLCDTEDYLGMPYSRIRLYFKRFESKH